MSEENFQPRLDKVLSRYSGDRSGLIPVLQAVQGEFGYIPAEAMERVAEFLRIPASSVYGVVTFYAQFYLTRQGRHRIKVCRGTACHVRGSKAVMDALSRKLGIQPGETTADYKYSLERVACFGSCALAPVLVVDNKVYGNIDAARAAKIVGSLE